MGSFHPQPDALADIAMQQLGEAEHQGVKLIVPGGLPGDRLRVRLIERQGKRWLSRVEEIIEPARERISPPCPIWNSDCACPLMAWNGGAQAKYKQSLLAEALGQQVQPLQLAAQTLAYRSKVVLVARKHNGRTRLGAYRRGSHAFLDLNGCIIEESPIAFVANQLREQLENVPAFDDRNGTGDLRYVVLRATAKSEVLVTFIGAKAPNVTLTAPQVKGVLFARNVKPGNAIWDEPATLLSGQAELIESIDGLSFRVSPPSFFQVHRAQASVLRSKLLEHARGHVWDLYCGVGVNALALAKAGHTVHGIEGFAGAVEDARANAALNGLDAKFSVADLEQATLPSEKPDTVVLNPPRKGAPLGLIEKVAALKPETVIYVACAPKPLGAAANLLKTLGYRIELAQPFDLFPQTEHVESLVVFRRIA